MFNSSDDNKLMRKSELMRDNEDENGGDLYKMVANLFVQYFCMRNQLMY